MAKKKNVAVIQARMGSSRLPGKVLMPVAGKPLLEHIIDRLRRSSTLDDIVIATSDKPSDDPLVDFAQTRGVTLVRGSEDNVLLRFNKAAEEVDADVIIRVTGDAPLVDPEVMDRLVRTLLQEGAEYCTIEAGIHSIHEGFCTFTREALKRLMTEASDDPVAIEHVTAYFIAHPDKFHIARIPVGNEHRFKGARLSVDTPADVQFFDELYRLLGVPAGDADIADVVRLLRNNPHLLQINQHVYQKKATDRSHKVLIRCDGDSRTGLGHVVRCLALAGELREKQGCGIIFAMASGEPGMEMVRQADFPLERQGDADEGEWMDELISCHHPDVLVLDIRNDLPVEKVNSWREEGILVVGIDDPTPRRLAADLLFYPPIPQISELNWNNFKGEIYSGWEWVLLRKQFCTSCPPRDNNPPVLLLTMGGSDPENFTVTVLRILDELRNDFKTIVVIGAGFVHEDDLQQFLAQARRNYRIEREVSDMASLMRQADLAIASFGVTAYELAASGVPAVYLCLTPDHARSASKFVDSRLAFSCGVLEECSNESIIETTLSLLDSRELRHEMGRRACATVDGYGAMRIATKIVEQLERMHSSNG